MSVSIINDRSAQLVMAVDGVGYDEARGRLERAALVVEADPDLDAAHQSALLAAVVCAVRMFNGGVFIDPTLTGRFTIGHERRRPLRAALEELGASSVTAPDHAVRLRIGWRQGDRPADLQAWCDGWSAVIGPTGTDAGPSASNVLCGVAAGGLAAAELFRRAVLDDILACKWRQRLDVWGPGDPPSDAALRKLPRQIWLLGLGNLGQASLFTLALLPWADTAEVSLVLNDVDTVGPENLAVQVLTTHAWVGQKKARAAAAWAEARGFKTIIEERRFTPATRPFGDEPALALVGVDNLQARRCAAEAGFGLVIDAGLGATGPEAFDIRLHSFPGAQTAQMAWPDMADLAVRPVSDGLAALVAQGRLDPCGAMTIAGTSVGAPCTAMVAAALQVAQACRALETGFCADRIDLSLADLRHAAWRLMAAAPPHLPTTLNGLSQA